MAHYITDAEGKLHKIAGNFNPSYEVNQLVAEKTVTSQTQNIIIDNLDIIRDGGVYDFVLEGCNSTTQDSLIYIRFNEKSNSRYFGSLIANNSSTPYGSTDNSVSQARVGVFAQNASFVTGTITLPMSCPLFNSISFDVQSTIQVVLFAGGYYDNQSNITSIRFNNATTFAVGTKVKIYKRMANATVMDSKLVADKIALGTTLTNQNDTVVESYVSSDGKTWYRKWASGWKECGMEIQHSGSISGSGIASQYITLPIEFSNTVYTVEMTTLYGGSASARCVWSYEAPTTNQMYAVVVNFSSSSSTSPKCKIYCSGF